MLLYVIVLLILFVSSYLEVLIKRKDQGLQKLFSYIYIIPIFLLFAFNRDNNDYQTYQILFEYKMDDFGYEVLKKIVKSFNGNHNWIIFTTASLSFYILINKKNIFYRITLLFLYYISNLLYDINIIRNTLMITFVYISLRFLENKKNILSIIFVILASTFHKVGIIYFIFYLLYFILRKKYFSITKKLLIMIILVTPFFVLSLETFQMILMKYIGEKANYFEIVKLGAVTNVVQVFFDVLLMTIYKNELKKDGEIDVNFKFFFFTLLFLPFCFINKEFYNRLYRNSLFAKWYYFLNKMKMRNLKVKIITYLILVVNAGLSILTIYIRNPIFVEDLMNNLLKFSFSF